MNKLINNFRTNPTNTPLVFMVAGLALLLVVILFHKTINQSVSAAYLSEPISIQSVDISAVQQEITTNQVNLSTRPPFPKDAGYSIQFLYNQTYPDPPFLMQE